MLSIVPFVRTEWVASVLLCVSPIYLRSLFCAASVAWQCISVRLKTVLLLLFLLLLSVFFFSLLDAAIALLVLLLLLFYVVESCVCVKDNCLFVDQDGR